MTSRTPSPQLPSAPQNTPFASRPPTSHSHPSPLTTLLSQLLPSAPLLAAKQSSSSPTRNAQISSLALHPTLEAALHILNSDLASAHFLVRKMGAPPAVEGMLLHAVLHRMEGDFGNARAWVGDVGDAYAGWVPKRRGRERLDGNMLAGIEGLLGFVYEGGEEGARRLVDDVERVRKGEAQDAERKEVEGRVRRELERMVEWCRWKFGDTAWEDATQAYTRPGEEVRRIGENMVTGDKGWRKF
ncbi:hypothetical protein EJ04DRAFT_500286 [Polyplosphaeria fusca]|uniref:Uncharacterized protein n=1 Tax=Polyplosphaeria fusca TaxID=682080 RepID=A0A9P4QT97_9PLEO|nr:hypothetical protein EJ04DRAFT_500286 [Polyplosphaeria fusca]